jgi:hypothetical protein
MASSYKDVADTMNTMFKTKASTEAAAVKFQAKHGSNGQGGGGKDRYRFGNFADDDLPTGRDKNKWLIDTGNRNWDVPSFNHLEKTIRDNLSAHGPQLPMQFTVKSGDGHKSHAVVSEVTDDNNNIVGYQIDIICRT